MAATRRRFLALVASVSALSISLRTGLARAQQRVLAIHEATRNTLLGVMGASLRRGAGTLPRAKSWQGAARIDLPEPAREPALSLASALAVCAPASGFANASFTSATLARLLHFTNGVTDRAGGVALRAAPSAGALYAGEVYLVAERVSDLAPGVYAFAPLEGRLVLLRPGSALGELARALEAPARTRAAAAAVLLTNVFERYARRYANRGYRYALIDSGHQGENLRLTALSAGLATWGPLRFEDDRLNELLGIDGVAEAVCALHLVGAPGDAVADSQRPARLVEAQRAGRPLPDAADDATERYHAATRLVPGAAPAELPLHGSSREAAAVDAACTALPGAMTRPLSVEDAIARRRSARRFLPAAVKGDDLAFVLAAAQGHPGLRRTPGLSLRLFAHRIEGMAPGLYAPEAGGALRALRREDLAEALVDACLAQRMAGEAAAALAMVAELPRMAELHGERVYRDLLLEAGSMGQRIYLAAEACGLAARNLAAFVDERLNGLAGLDGRERAVLHLTLLGVGD